MNKIIFILLLLLSSLPSSGASDKDLWSQANLAVQAGDYSQGIRTYLQIKNYQESPQVLFNVGTVYLKNNQVGHAILYLEKALKLQPNDKSIRQNLAAAEAKIINPIVNQEIKLIQWVKSFVYGMSINAWAVFLLLVIVAGLILFYSKWHKASWYRKAAIALITSSVFVTTVILIRLSYFDQLQYVVTVGSDQPYFSDVALRDMSTRLIPEGTKARLIAIQNDVFKIQLPNGIICFVKKHNFEPL